MVQRRVRKVSGECDDGTCPAVYVSDRGTAVVQGDWLAEAEGMTLGPGETAVELPPEIVLAAVAELVRCAGAEWTERLGEALRCC